ncbi:Lar family restriction alleviation protein [Blautia hansenii]|uniref:Lar family restriction alleviation protein n=1 Tax=Blautia hansenii TaxID=1322 RepID=UPI003A7F5AD3
MNGELKKCPFCGGKAKIYKSFDYVSKYRVECTKCWAHTPNYDKPKKHSKHGIGGQNR